MPLDEQKLSEEFQQLVGNPNSLDFCANYIFDELVEEIIMYIVFENHFELKNHKQETKQEEYDTIKSEEKSQNENVDQKTQNIDNNNNYDDSISLNSSKKGKIVYCKCSNCQKIVCVQKYASHLENCMGIGRKRLRKRKEPS